MNIKLTDGFCYSTEERAFYPNVTYSYELLGPPMGVDIVNLLIYVDNDSERFSLQISSFAELDRFIEGLLDARTKLLEFKGMAKKAVD